MPTIGVTGNFGMGKSTVLRMFQQLGALTFDSDDFVRTLLGSDIVIRKISDVLGSDVLVRSSGHVSLNKKKVADIIFADPLKRKAVEKLIHPEVLKAIKRTESDALKKAPSALIVFEVPLLFEAGYERHFDRNIVVYCRRDTALERLAKKGFAKNEALKRLRAQMPVRDKKQLADFIIDNSDGDEQTRKQVQEIYSAVMNA